MKTYYEVTTLVFNNGTARKSIRELEAAKKPTDSALSTESYAEYHDYFGSLKKAMAHAQAQLPNPPSVGCAASECGRAICCVSCDELSDCRDAYEVCEDAYRYWLCANAGWEE